MRYLPQELDSYRKDIVRFAWTHLKSDTSLTKLWAYVCMSRFIASYPCPSKIVIQVFTALLRIHAPETRYYVNKALDILIPSLPKRLPNEHHRYSAWLKWTKKILTEEGHQLPLAIHIYAALIRHAPLFYPSRLQFIPAMINNLNKIGLSSARSVEHRRLALQMAELIVAWDKQAQYEHNQSTEEKRMEVDGSNSVDSVATSTSSAVAAAVDGSGTPVPAPVGGVEMSESPSKRQALQPMAVDETSPADTAAAAGASPAGPQANGVPSASVNPWLSIDSTGSSPQLVELLLTFLFRLALMTCDAPETRTLSKRCTKLVRSSMELWKDAQADVKLTVIDKILSNAPPSHDMTLLYTTAYELVSATLQFAPAAYIVQQQNILFIDKLLTATITSAKLMTPALRDGVVDTLTHVSQHYPMRDVTTSGELSKMYKTLRDIVASALKQLDKQPSLFIHMSLLGAINQTYPAFVLQHMQLVIKALAKLTRDVLTRQQQLIQHQQALVTHRATVPLTQEEKMKTLLISDALRKCLALTYQHINQLGEGKKVFLSSVTLLIEKSNDMALLSDLSKQLEQWMWNDQAMTPKEKCLLLLKMTSREREKGYHDILNSVLNTTLLLFRERRYEWLPRLQRAFFVGLRADDAQMRAQFQALLISSLQATLPDRLYYILVTQDWEVMSDSYWPGVCVMLLLNAIKPDDPLLLKPGMARLPSFDYHWHDGSSKGGSGRRTGEGVRFNRREKEGEQSKKRSFSKAFGEQQEAEATKAREEERKEDDKTTKPAAPSTLLLPELTRSGLLSAYTDWLHAYGNAQTRDMVDALSDLSYYAIPIAHELFVALFSSGWSHLTPQQRTEIAPAVSSLLAKPWQTRYEYEGWNRSLDRIHPMQTLLAAVHAAKPPIYVAAEVVRYAGKMFNGWHTAVELLEDRMANASLESSFSALTLVTPVNEPVPPPPTSASTGVATADALCQLYRELNEDDLWYGVWRHRCSSEWSVAALSQCQFGAWQRAQDGLYSAMQRHAHDALLELPSHKHEEAMWESEWVNAARHLNQWEVIKDFAHHTGMVELQMDAVWRLGEFNTLKELVSRYKDSDVVSGRLFNLYHLLHERKTTTDDISKLIDHTVQSSVLREWQSLPPIITQTHLPLLQKAQRITELIESTTALDDISKAARQQSLPNFKNLISTWRERTPNKWSANTTHNHTAAVTYSPPAPRLVCVALNQGAVPDVHHPRTPTSTTRTVC